MRKLLLLLIAGTIFLQTSYAQTDRCGTVEHEAILKAKYPGYEQKRADIEDFTAKYIQKKQSLPTAKTEGGGLIVRIPVVFHVVYKTAAQNIADDLLLQQLDILNADFRRLNADTTDTPAAFADVAADLGIEFCLAQIDPDGNPTTGILRVSTTVSSFTTDDNVKFTADGGDDAWPADSYLNFWVCNLGASLLGYAQFPGGPDATDGVVIHYNHVGYNDAGYPYHLGRTATHEVGHWLNLRHIWGDDTNCTGTDLVADTPNQKVNTWGCPSYPETDMCSPDAPGIMFQNYMDYTDDPCMNMFTEGQKNRSSALFELGGTRYSLVNSEGCGLQPYDAQSLAALPGGTICNLTFSPSVTIKNHGTELLTSVDIVYTIDGGAPSTYNWTGSLLTGSTEEVTLPSITTTEGEHELEATLENPNGFVDADETDNTSTTTFIVSLSSLPLPLTQGFEPTGFPYDGYTISNPDLYYTWERTNDAASLGTYSIYMDHFNNDAIGSVDDFVIPAYDISGLATISFTFDVGYALYTASGAYSDTLEVLASDDCGETWTIVYKKANPDLQTAPPETSSFEPADDEWRNESIDLTDYLGSEQLFIMFRTISDYENNLFIDNINLNDGQVTGINDISNDFNIVVYPTPASDLMHVRYNLDNAAKCDLVIYDMLGKVVYAEKIGGAKGINVTTVPVGDLGAGYYRVKVSNEKENASVPFIKE